jgi:alkylated DNA repair dioxygenase AlkB
VAIISLLSPYLLDFIPLDPQRDKLAIDLAPRSLLVVGGEARSHYQHGIAPRKSDRVGGTARTRCRRVSVTFRYSIR